MTIWDEQAQERLVELWNAGYPASQIGNEFGVSRNAVMGKVHRMRVKAIGELRRRVEAEGKRPSRKRKRQVELRNLHPIVRKALRPKKPRREITEPRPMPSDLNISILDDRLSAMHCRGIVEGDGPETIFCGRPIDTSAHPFRYCSACAARYLMPHQGKAA